MTLNAVMNESYARLATQYGNGVAEGFAGYTVEGDNVLFTESNGGEGFTVTLADLQLTPEQLAELQNAQNANGTTAANGATSTSGKNSDEIQAEIDALNEQREDKLEIMEQIEKQIDTLAKDAEQKIAAAAAEREKRAEEYEENVKNAIDKNVREYVSANKSGKEMSQEELQANVKNSVAEFAPDLAEVVSGLFVANSEIALIEAYVINLKSMAGEVGQLETDISAKTQEYNTAKAAEEAAAAARSCEPQGFQVEENGETVQYDFFVDRDGDGKLSDMTEFLGAKNAEGAETDEEMQQKGWEEMTNLNQNGDGYVDYSELLNANKNGTADGEIMVMRTVIGPDGTKTQQPMTIEEAFGGENYNKNIKIAINQHDELSPDNVSFGNDFYNDKYSENKLLGNFDVILGGNNAQTVTGYQTKDDVNFLADKFQFSKGLLANTTTLDDNMNTTTRVVDGEEVQMSEELANHYALIEGYETTISTLRTSLQTEWDALGLDKDRQELMNEFAGVEAQAKADAFVDEIEEAQKARKAAEGGDEETDSADGADGSDADGEIGPNGKRVVVAS